MRNSWGIKSRMILLISLTITVIGLTSWLLLMRLVNLDIEQNLKLFNSISTGVSNAIEAQFYERYGDVQAFAQNPIFKSHKRSDMTTALNDYAKLYGIYESILVLDRQGNLIATNDLSPTGQKINTSSLFLKNYSKETWFLKTIKKEFTAEVAKGFDGTYFEELEVDPIVSEIYKKNMYGASFTAPIKNEKDEIIGVVSNRSNSQWVQGPILDSFSQLKNMGFFSTEFSIISKGGVVLLEYDPKSNNNKTDFDFNFEVLNKLNLAEKGVGAANELVNNKEGAGFYQHTRKNVEQIVGYSKLAGPKIVDSIGWGVLVRADKNEVMDHLNKVMIIFYSTFSIVIIFCLAVAIFFSNGLTKSLIRLSEELGQNSIKIKNASLQIKDSSIELSNSTTQQAAAIEETVSSMEEMSSMLAQTSEQTREGLRVAELGQMETEKGKEVIAKMSNSMSSIEESNDKLQKIISLIDQIQSKTKIINDIVFETRLLSFNASIEAARASVHGKGFAVVAEEIGKLATVSGKAAEEINSLLESSTKEVSSIVEDIKSRVVAGKSISEECKNSFYSMENTFEQIVESVKLITSATSEQASGVKQTNAAMSEMEQVTQKNSKNSENLATEASPLADIAFSLNNSVILMNEIILGKNKVINTSAKTEVLNDSEISLNKRKIIGRNDSSWKS